MRADDLACQQYVSIDGEARPSFVSIIATAPLIAASLTAAGASAIDSGERCAVAVGAVSPSAGAWCPISPRAAPSPAWKMPCESGQPDAPDRFKGCLR